MRSPAGSSTSGWTTSGCDRSDGWLDPGTSALLVLVRDEVGPSVLRELGRFEGTVLYCTFPDAVRAELERVLETHARASRRCRRSGPPVDPDAEPGI